MKIKILPIYIVIFFAGFSFLIYEVSWNRFLSLILGTTEIASTIVLSAFMTGFGLGAYVLGRIANKSSKPSRLLSFVVLGIGVTGFVNYFIIGRLFLSFFGSVSNELLADILFFSSVFILLLIPSFLMGGLIPLAGKLIIYDFKSIRNIGNIYAVETLGSSLGGIMTGFVFLGTFGQLNTILIAIAINVAIALFLFINKKPLIQPLNSSINPPNSKGSSSKKNKTLSNSPNFKTAKIALISTFVIGLTMLCLQIIWIRIFKTYFTNTSYTFSLIAAFVIFGYSIGSYIFKKRNASIKSLETNMLRIIFIMMGVILIGLLLLFILPDFLMFPFKESAENAVMRIFLIPLWSCILIVLPPSILSGYAFPLACSMYRGNDSDVGKNIGYVLMMNTLGALLGPLIAAFILIPLIGAGKSLLLLSIILSSLTVYIAIQFKTEKKRVLNKNFFIGQTILLFLLLLFIGQIRFYPPSIKQNENTVLLYDESSKGTITVINEKQKGIFGNSSFVNNSSVIGSNYDAIKAVKLVGHIPFFAGLKCENALIIGFGIGVTTSAIASHPEVKKIDCVELLPDLVESARFYNDFNNAVYRDKRLHVISGDGRHFLQMTENKYDLISCDPTHPVLGSGNLYTKEYFIQCLEHLNPNGMVSQYLPLHKLRWNDLLGIIKTFHSVFPNSSVWLGQYHAILIGKNGTGKINFQTWKKNIEKMPADMFLYLQPYHIAANVVMSSEMIKNLPDNIKINTDDLNYTEFFSLECFNPENAYENLNNLSKNRCNINEVFSDMNDSEIMNKFVKGNTKLTESLYFSLLGDRSRALKSLREACIINPEDQEYPFLIKFYFGTGMEPMN